MALQDYGMTLADNPKTGSARSLIFVEDKHKPFYETYTCKVVLHEIMSGLKPSAVQNFRTEEVPFAHQ